MTVLEFLFSRLDPWVLTTVAADLLRQNLSENLTPPQRDASYRFCCAVIAGDDDAAHLGRYASRFKNMPREVLDLIRAYKHLLKDRKKPWGEHMRDCLKILLEKDNDRVSSLGDGGHTRKGNKS